MSATIDTRVVEMQFDNQEFEKGIETTRKSLDELNKSLRMDDSAKAFREMGDEAEDSSRMMTKLASAADTVTQRFSMMGIMVNTALQNITNSIYRTATTFVKSLTIDPITTGFSEYTTQIDAVQTILANTGDALRKEGLNEEQQIERVNQRLDELNRYADKTIYNFTEMTRNIGTFTAAGIELDTATLAIKGMSNLAAAAGASAQNASRAYYQMSQALSTGTMKLMDWNSMVNAGIGGEMTQKAFKRTADAMGKTVEASIDGTKRMWKASELIDKVGFRESLQYGWLTKDVITATLEQFSWDVEEMAKEAGITVEEQKKILAQRLRDSGNYSEQEINDIFELARTANDAATKVKTLTQLVDTLKEAAQSGWTESWEIIVGGFGEAKELFTYLSDTIGAVIQVSSDARNEMLRMWKKLGGRDHLIAALKNIFDSVKNISSIVKKAFSVITPSLKEASNIVFKLTEGIQNATAKLNVFTGNEKSMQLFAELFGEIAKIAKALAPAFKSIFSMHLQTIFTKIGIAASKLTVGARALSASLNTIRNSKSFNEIIKFVGKLSEKVNEAVKKLYEFVQILFTLRPKEYIDENGKAVEGLALWAHALSKVAGAIAGEIKKAFGKANTILLDFLRDLVGLPLSTDDEITAQYKRMAFDESIFGIICSKIDSLLEKLNVVKLRITAWSNETFGAIWEGIKNWFGFEPGDFKTFKSAFAAIRDALSIKLTSGWESISKFFHGLFQAFSEGGFKGGFDYIASAIDVLMERFGDVGVFLRNAATAIANSGFVKTIRVFFSGLAAVIEALFVKLFGEDFSFENLGKSFGAFFESLPDRLAEMWEGWKEAWSLMSSTTEGDFQNGLKVFFDSIKGVFDGTFVEDFVNFVQNFFHPTIEAIKTLFQTIADLLIGKAVAETTIEASRAMDGMGEIIDLMANPVFSEGAKAASEAVTNISNTVESAFTTMGETMGSIDFSEFGKNVIDGLSTVTSKMLGVTSSVPWNSFNKVAKFFKTLLGMIATVKIGKSITGAVKNFGGMFTTIGSIGKELAGGMISIFKGRSETLKETLEGLTKNVGEFSITLQDGVKWKRKAAIDWSKLILSVAGAILLVAGAIWVITQAVNSCDNFGVVVATVAGIAAVLGAISLLGKVKMNNNIGETMRNMGIALLAVAGSIWLISKIDQSTLDIALGVVTAIGVFMAIFAALIAGAGPKGSDEKLRKSSADPFIGMAVLIAVMTICVGAITDLVKKNKGSEDALSGAVAIIVILVMIVGLLGGLISTASIKKGQKQVRGFTTLLGVAVVLLTISHVLKKITETLSMNPVDTMVAAILIIGFLEMCAIVVEAAGKHKGQGSTRGFSTLLGVCAVLLTIADVLRQLMEIPFGEDWLRNIAVVGGALVLIGGIVWALGKTSKESGKAFWPLVAVCGILLVIGNLFNTIAGLSEDQYNRGITVLAGTFVAIGVIIFLLSKMKTDVQAGSGALLIALAAVIPMIVAVAGIWAALQLLKEFDTDRIIAVSICIGGLLVVMAIVAAVCAGFGAVAGKAIEGALALGIIMIILIAAVGVSVTIGGAAVDNIAATMERFGQAVSNFSDKVANVDEEKMLTVSEALAKVFAKTSTGGLGAWLTDKFLTSLAKLGAAIYLYSSMTEGFTVEKAEASETVARSIKNAVTYFNDAAAIGGIDTDKLGSVFADVGAGLELYNASLGDKTGIGGITDFSFIPTVMEGIAQNLPSQEIMDSISSFGAAQGETGEGLTNTALGIVSLGTAIGKFAKASECINEDDQTRVEEFLTFLSSFQHGLTNFNFAKGFLLGIGKKDEDGLTGFSVDITTLGAAIEGFSKGIKGFDSDQSSSVTNFLQGLSDLEQGLRSQDFWEKLFVGETSLTTFGLNLSSLAGNVETFIDTINGTTFDQAKADGVMGVLKSASALTSEYISYDNDRTEMVTAGYFLGTFAKDLSTLGDKYKQFAAAINQANGIDDARIDSLIKVMTGLSPVAKDLNGLSFNSVAFGIMVKGLGSAFADLFGKEGVLTDITPPDDDTIKMFTDISAVVSSAIAGLSGVDLGKFHGKNTYVSDAFNTILSGLSTAVVTCGTNAAEAFEGLRGRFANAGAYVAEGIIDGLNSKRARLSNAARDLANMAVGVLSGVLKIASPSKVTKQIGAYFGEGAAIGIADSTSQVVDASANMAYSALEATRSAWDIHSPSKAAEMFGSMYGAGAAAGVNNSSKTVANAAQNLANVANKNLQDGFGPIATNILDQLTNVGGQYVTSFTNGIQNGVGDIPLVGDLLKNNGMSFDVNAYLGGLDFSSFTNPMIGGMSGLTESMNGLTQMLESNGIKFDVSQYIPKEVVDGISAIQSGNVGGLFDGIGNVVGDAFKENFTFSTGNELIDGAISGIMNAVTDKSEASIGQGYLYNKTDDSYVLQTNPGGSNPLQPIKNLTSTGTKTGSTSSSGSGYLNAGVAGVGASGIGSYGALLASSEMRQVVEKLTDIRDDVAVLKENVANLQVVLDSGELVGATAVLMDEKLGQLAARRVRGN